MERGWIAEGLLRPLWEKFPGKREELAEMTGITPQTLSAYNSGARRLGAKNAQRIAEATGVSLADLGSPSLGDEDVAVRLARLEGDFDLLAGLTVRALELLEAPALLAEAQRLVDARANQGG